jgi:ATP-dependent Clp protease ATP-binding subunit ClpA
MHFSGPTGVGKTHTADIVAKSVLARPVDGAQNKEKDLCGKMAVQMRAFVSTAPEDIDANAQELRSKVAEQLYNCPRSVIIFDEIQSVPEDLLDKVIGMFDPGEGEALSHQIKTVFHPVNTSLCIVIAISDLGSTKLAPSMDREQAKRVIQEEADNRFVRSKKKALLNNIVPFLSLSVDELVKVGDPLCSSSITSLLQPFVQLEHYITTSPTSLSHRARAFLPA